MPLLRVASMENDCRKIFLTTSPISFGIFCIPYFSSELIFDKVADKSLIAVFSATFVCGRNALLVPVSLRRTLSTSSAGCRLSIGRMPVVSINGIALFSSLLEKIFTLVEFYFIIYRLSRIVIEVFIKKSTSEIGSALFQSVKRSSPKAYKIMQTIIVKIITSPN